MTSPIPFRHLLKNFYQKQAFRPGFWAFLFHSSYLVRRDLHRALQKHLGTLGPCILDVGCGSRPYESLARARKYIGLEHYHARKQGGRGKRPDVYFDGKNLPIKAGSFDAVLCTEVLEHVFEPQDFLRQIAYTLKEKGVLLMTVPLAMPEHEVPYDYGRYTSYGMRYLLQKTGYVSLEYQALCSGLAGHTQLLVFSLEETLRTGHPALNYLLRLFFLSPLLFLGLLLGKLPVGKKSFWITSLVLAQKKKNKPYSLVKAC